MVVLGVSVISRISYGIKGVKVFDTILARRGNNTTSRNSADFWSAFCKASGWKFSYERIHSLADAEYFFSRKSIIEDIIIFSGHGHDEKGFQLSNDELIDGKSILEVK